jgi:hypothetical protein
VKRLCVELKCSVLGVFETSRSFFFFFFFCLIMVMELRVFYMQGKPSTTELHLQPQGLLSSTTFCYSQERDTVCYFSDNVHLEDVVH